MPLAYTLDNFIVIQWNRSKKTSNRVWVRFFLFFIVFSDVIPQLFPLCLFYIGVFHFRTFVTITL